MKVFCAIVLFCCFSTLLVQAQWVAKEKKGKFGYVDSSGKIQIPYEYPFVFTDTLKTIAFVAVDSNIWAIDKKNEKLFKVLNYDNGPDYEREGLFRIVGKEDKIGFANIEGEVVIPPTYSFAFPFSEGFAAFNIDGKEIVIDDFDNHTMIVGGKWGYIDKKGFVIFPPIFDEAGDFKDKKARVKIGEYVFSVFID